MGQASRRDSSWTPILFRKLLFLYWKQLLKF